MQREDLFFVSETLCATSFATNLDNVFWIRIKIISSISSLHHFNHNHNAQFFGGQKRQTYCLIQYSFISTLNENFVSVFPLCLFNFGGCFQSCSILRVFAKYIMKIIRVCALWWSGELSPLKRANCFHWDEILILRLIFVGFQSLFIPLSSNHCLLGCPTLHLFLNWATPY